MTNFNSRTECFRCGHPYAWHRPLESSDLDPIEPTDFRCYGHAPEVEGSRRGCLQDCRSVDPQWLPPLIPREATQDEIDIARAWLRAKDYGDTASAEHVYRHALALLVFANARPAGSRRRS